MVYRKKSTDIVKDTKEVLELIKERGHDYIEGSYRNREAVLIVWCPIHNNEHTTTFHNYKRSRTGCPCCGKAQASNKLKGRQFSEETIQKMSSAAQTRPLRGGKPRRWRETHSYRQWRKAVLKAYNNECAVTGIKLENTGDLEVHHLYGANTRTDLTYVVENGIVLHKDIHVSFHKKYSFNNNTLEQFLSFLN